MPEMLMCMEYAFKLTRVLMWGTGGKDRQSGARHGRALAGMGTSDEHRHVPLPSPKLLA